MGRKAGRWRTYGGRGPGFLPIDSISPHLLQHLGLMRHVDVDPDYILPFFFFLTAYPLPLTNLYAPVCRVRRVRRTGVLHLSSCQRYTSATCWRDAGSTSTRRARLPSWLWCPPRRPPPGPGCRDSEGRRRGLKEFTGDLIRRDLKPVSADQSCYVVHVVKP